MLLPSFVRLAVSAGGGSECSESDSESRSLGSDSSRSITSSTDSSSNDSEGEISLVSCDSYRSDSETSIEDYDDAQPAKRQRRNTVDDFTLDHAGFERFKAMIATTSSSGILPDANSQLCFVEFDCDATPTINKVTASFSEAGDVLPGSSRTTVRTAFESVVLAQQNDPTCGRKIAAGGFNRVYNFKQDAYDDTLDFVEYVLRFPHLMKDDQRNLIVPACNIEDASFQLEELFQTLALHCILGSKDIHFVGAFVETVKNIEGNATWTQPFYNVAYMIKKATSLNDVINYDNDLLDGYQEKVRTVALQWIEATKEASKKGVVLFDNKMENATQSGEGTVSLIDFDLSFTLVLKAKNGDLEVVRATATLLNSMAVLLHCSKKFKFLEGRVWTYSNENPLLQPLLTAAAHFATAIETINVLLPRSESLRQLVGYLMMKKRETDKNFKGSLYCTGPLSDSTFAIDVERKEDGSSNDDLKNDFVYDVGDSKVVTCLARKIVFMMTHYTKPKEGEALPYTDPEKQWWYHFVEDMLPFLPGNTEDLLKAKIAEADIIATQTLKLTTNGTDPRTPQTAELRPRLYN